MSNILQELQSWYKGNCDGNWEHQFGVKIDTIDNQGWRVEIDLTETEWETVNFARFEKRVAESDWIICFKQNARFIGAGDPDKLEEILSYFFGLVKK